MTRKIRYVSRETVAGEVFTQICHQAAIGRESMNQNHRSGWIHAGRWVNQCHGHVATAIGDCDLLLGQFPTPNPDRSQYHAYDACDGQSRFPPFHLEPPGEFRAHARIASLRFSAVADWERREWAT